MSVKLIKHTGECALPDDPSLPFRLELVMRAPSFMNVTFVVLYGGTEDVVARASNLDELVEWMHERGLRDHPRLIRFAITDNTGKTVMGCDQTGRHIQ